VRRPQFDLGTESENGMKTSRIATALAVLTIGSPLPLFAADGFSTELFTVNLGTSVWTGIVFFALLGILWKFAWGPILAAIDDRETGIQSALDEAAAKQAEAQALLEEHRAMMAGARRDAQQILAEAKEAGQQVRQDKTAHAALCRMLGDGPANAIGGAGDDNHHVLELSGHGPICPSGRWSGRYPRHLRLV